jgi:GGDEF domain-containing protein
MDVLLTVLAGAGCIAMMGAAMVVLPRIGRRVQRSPRAQRLISRLRSQSAIDRLLSWVEGERPDVGRATAPDGTVTILFTDIEDSTALNERLGDRRWLELLRAHNAIVRDCVREHGGYEVKAQGDGFMVAYPSAREALGCAVDMERKLASGDGGLGDQRARARLERAGIRAPSLDSDFDRLLDFADYSRWGRSLPQRHEARAIELGAPTPA